MAVEAGVSAPPRSISAYTELPKPGIPLLVALTAAAGYCLGSPTGINYLGLLNMVVGVALLASGISALNQYIERDLDRLMRRTELRPLPTGRLSPLCALLFGAGLSLIAIIYLAALVSPLTAALGMATFGSYLFLYTPLKTKTTLSTVLGAFPAATPPLIGWVAARGPVTVWASVLVAILSLW